MTKPSERDVELADDWFYGTFGMVQNAPARATLAQLLAEARLEERERISAWLISPETLAAMKDAAAINVDTSGDEDLMHWIIRALAQKGSKQ